MGFWQITSLLKGIGYILLIYISVSSMVICVYKIEGIKEWSKKERDQVFEKGLTFL